MNILLVADNFPPERNAPAHRLGDITSRWAEIPGVHVEVVTCFPNFPTGKKFKGYETTKIYRKEVFNKALVHRVITYMAPNEGFFKRSIDYLSFGLVSTFAPLFLTKRPDVVIASTPQPFTIIGGFVLSKFYRSKFVVEVRDIWPYSLVGVGRINAHSRLYRLLEWLELKAYEAADKVVIVSPAFEQNILKRINVPVQFHFAPNGFEPENHMGAPVSCEKIKASSVINIIYAGTVGEAHGLDIVIRACRTLRAKNLKVKFTIYGAGANWSFFKKQVLIQELTSTIDCREFVDKPIIISELDKADAILVHLKNVQVFDEVIPSKIFEAFMRGKPVLHGVNGISRNIVERYQLGHLFTPENPDSLCSAIEYLKQYGHSQSAEAFSAFAEDYSREKIAMDYFDALQQISR